MTIQKAKRIRRDIRLKKPVRLSKKGARKLGITGKRPVKGYKRVTKEPDYLRLK